MLEEKIEKLEENKWIISKTLKQKIFDDLKNVIHDNYIVDINAKFLNNNVIFNIENKIDEDDCAEKKTDANNKKLTEMKSNYSVNACFTENDKTKKTKFRDFLESSEGEEQVENNNCNKLKFTSKSEAFCASLRAVLNKQHIAYALKIVNLLYSNNKNEKNILTMSKRKFCCVKQCIVQLALKMFFGMHVEIFKFEMSGFYITFFKYFLFVYLRIFY
jgi:hypothetical protein